VALVGPSGAGKTTITSLIPRFFDVSEGTVRFAGVDVRDCDQDELISHIGILSQETFLFNDTIAENIAYAREGATHQEIEEAAAAENALDVLLGLLAVLRRKVIEDGEIQVSALVEAGKHLD
jgi:ATP-binding cassette subfamily B protein